jgi:SAM-dependent methyltransferase
MRLLKPWLWHCNGCGFLASSLSPNAGAAFDELELLRRQNFEILLNRLERIRPMQGLTLLEVGCDTGLFLEAAGRRGAQVLGMEPERKKGAIAHSKGFNVAEGFFPDTLADGSTYDVIAFNDVFEHLPNPKAALQQCEARLNAGGLLILNLPSSCGIIFLAARLLDRLGFVGPLERLWQKNFPSPHLSYFNPQNLCVLVEKSANLDLVHQSSLKSVTARGLKPRIRMSIKEPLATAVHLGLLPLVALQRILPSDICLQIYRKK